MRGVSRRVSYVALLLAVSLVFGSVAWAGEASPPPTNPPEWRINPPGGLSVTDMLLIWLQSRLIV